MGTTAEIFLERSGNEILAAESLKKLSAESKAKEEFGLPSQITFYSAVISHSYYAIFYASKAILRAKEIKTSAPEIHKKTFEAFEKEIVNTGILDIKLLEIYRKMVVRADELLEIFKDEKWKRGHFTYKTIPQANIEPALESLENARMFVSTISNVMKRM